MAEDTEGMLRGETPSATRSPVAALVRARVRRLLASSTLRAVTEMAGANAVGQLLIFIALPFVARQYGPAAFGMHALVTSFVGVVSVGAGLCLELAIVSGRDTPAADELFAGAIMSTALTTLVAGAAFAALIFFDLFGYGRLPWWSIGIAAAITGLNGLYGAARYRTLRDQRFSVLARVALSQNAGRAVAPIGWHFVVSGWLGLTLGELTGRLVGLRGLLVPLLPRLRATQVWGDVTEWRSLVWRERRFTGALVTLMLIDASASLLIAPLLSGAYGADAAGEYFLVANVLVAPSALIGFAVADIMHVRGARLHLEAPHELPAFMRKFALLLLAVACAIYLPIAIAAPWAFPLLLGERWARAAQIAQAMMPFIIVAFVASPSARLMTAVNRPHWKVWSDALRLAGMPLLIHLCARAHVPFRTAMWYLSWFLAICYLFYFMLTAYAVSSSRVTPTIQPAPKDPAWS